MLFFFFAARVASRSSAANDEDRQSCTDAIPKGRRRSSSPPPCAVVALSSPLLLVVCAMLWVDGRSDHPFFWWSMPVIICVGNIAATFLAERCPLHRLSISRWSRGCTHLLWASVIGAALFLMTGAASGFFMGIAPLLTEDSGLLRSLIATLGLTAFFCVASFAHAVPLHAAISGDIARSR